MCRSPISLIRLIRKFSVGRYCPLMSLSLTTPTRTTPAVFGGTVDGGGGATVGVAGWAAGGGAVSFAAVAVGSAAPPINDAISIDLHPCGASNSGGSSVADVSSTTSVDVVNVPCSLVIVMVCFSGNPGAAPPPLPFITTRSRHDGWLGRPIPPHAIARTPSSPQENAVDKSAYHPSVSIFICDWLQASGLDSTVIEVLICRAL